MAVENETAAPRVPMIVVGVHDCVRCFAIHTMRRACVENKFDLADGILNVLIAHGEAENADLTRAKIDSFRAAHRGTVS